MGNNKKIEEILNNYEIPKMFKVKQLFSQKHIESNDIHKKIFNLLNKNDIKEKIKPGARIAITASSRGIANADIILKSIVDFVKEKGAIPFIVPAMGSHGGATAEGQLNVLKEYNITEKNMGCKIVSSLEVVNIGKNEKNMDVYIDKKAFEADGIIINCRIKPHTLFRGKHESGILKMMAIGLGNQKGAELCHSEGVENLAENVYYTGKYIMEHTNILFAVATIDNFYNDTYDIYCVSKERILEEEPKLLKKAFNQIPRLLLDKCDVLIVDEIGKNYSGDGLDPNVTGRFVNKKIKGGINPQKIIALDVSDKSHGNALGIGYCDIITERLFNKIDFESMYMNAITSDNIVGANIPMIINNDKNAIQLGIKTSNSIDKNGIKIIRIPNTLELEEIWLSESYYDIIKNDKRFEILSDSKKIEFDSNNNIVGGKKDE